MSGSATSSASTSPSKLQISVSTGSLPMPSSSPIPSPTSSVVSFTLPSPAAAASTTGSTGTSSSTSTAPPVRMTRGQRLRDQAAAARSTATVTPEPVVPTNNNDPNMKKRMVAKTRTSATLGQEVLNKIKPTNPMNPLPLNNLSGSSSSSSSSTPLATSVPSARIRNRRPILVVKGGNTRNQPSARGSTAQAQASTTGAGAGGAPSSRPSTATTTGKHPRLSLTDRAILQDICIIQDWLTTVKQNKNLTQFSHIVDKLKTAIFLPTQVKRQRVKQRGVPSDRAPRMLHRMSQAQISRPSSAQPPLSSEGEDSGREYVVAGQGHEEEDTEDDFILNDDDELDAKMTQYINRTEQDDDNLLMRRTVKSPTGVVFENGRWVASSAATAGTPSVHRHVGAGNITSLTSLSSLLIKSTSGTSTPMNELNDDIISSLSSNADNDADGEGGSLDDTDEPLEQVPTYQEFPDNLDDIADFDDDPSSGNVSSSNNQPILSDVLSPSSTSSAYSSPKSSLTRLSSTSSLLATSSDTTVATSTSTSASTSSTTSTSTSTLPAPNRLQHFREASADFDVGTEFQLSHEQRRKLAPIHVIAKPTSASSHTPMTDVGDDDDMDVFDNIPDFDNSPSNKFDISDGTAMSTSNSASSSVISSPSSSQRAQGRDSITSNPSLSIHVSTISPQMLTITTMRTSNNPNTPNNNTSTGTGSGANSSASSPSMKTSSITNKTPTHLSTFKPALSTVYSPPEATTSTSTSTSTSTTTSTSLAAPTLDLDDMSDGDEISSRSRAPSTHDATDTDDTRTDNEVDAELDEMAEAIAIKPETNASTPTHATPTQPMTGNVATATHDDTTFPDDLDDLEGFPDEEVTTDDTSTSTSTKSRSTRRTSDASTEDEMINHTTDMTGMSGPSSRILHEFVLSPELTSNLQSCADSHNKTYSCLTPYLGKASSLTTKDPFQPQFVVGWMLELGKHFANATELGNSS